MSKPKVDLSNSDNRDPRVGELRVRTGDYLGANSAGFLQAMVDRLGFGAVRYGNPPPEYFVEHDMAASAVARLDAFMETRDPEMLIDAANFCLLEYLCGVDHVASGMWTGEHSPGIVRRRDGARVKARGAWAHLNGRLALTRGVDLEHVRKAAWDGMATAISRWLGPNYPTSWEIEDRLSWIDWTLAMRKAAQDVAETILTDHTA